MLQSYKFIVNYPLFVFIFLCFGYNKKPQKPFFQVKTLSLMLCLNAFPCVQGTQIKASSHPIYHYVIST